MTTSQCWLRFISLLTVAACSSQTAPPPPPPLAASFDVSGLATSVVAAVASFTVTAKDTSGRTVTAYTGTVHFTTTDPGAVVPPDYTFVRADAGTKTFTATFETIGVQTLTATDTASSSITGSSQLTVAATLVFTGQPSTTQGGEPITPPVSVAIQNASGITMTSVTAAVTLGLGANPHGGTLAGPTTVNAVAGVATFSNLTVDRPWTGYTLVATAPGFIGATSAPFNMKLTFTSVTAGGAHTCGLTPAHEAYCWGYNGYGQLGDGTTLDHTIPGAVGGSLRFTAVSAGYDHTCGLAVAGSAYCWGDNGYGQLGDGTTTSRTIPVPVLGGLSFAAVAAGDANTCGVTTAGAAYCWGYNVAGQLGDGTTANRTTPVGVLGGLIFVGVSAGGSHSCGVTTAGAAYCWGSNVVGSLGDGTTTDRSSPVAVVGGLTFSAVTASGTLTCGVTTSSAGYCWGGNAYGELGNGTVDANQWSPWPVAGGLSLAAITAGGQHGCAMTVAGSGYCWGYNDLGQLGDGTTTQRLSPVLIAGAITFAGMSAALLWHSCGVTSSGTALCWGDNSSGQLGDGTLSDRYAPVNVIQ